MSDPAEKLPIEPHRSSLEAPGELRAGAMLRLIAQREHSLLSLMELSSELTVSLDLFGIADLALYNLMGQLGTSKAAIWIVPPDSRDIVLLRCHGVRKPVARAMGTVRGRELARHLFDQDEAVPTAELLQVLEPASARLVAQTELVLFCPITARENLIGIIGLGPKISGDAYETVDFGALRGSMGMLGVALENTRLYNQLLEKHRQIRRANESLKELDRLKSEFLRNVNHELRTPLTIIVAYVDVLMREEGKNEEFLKVAAGESVKLQALVEKLLEFSDLTQRSLEIRLETGNLAEFVTRFHEDRLPGVAESLRELTLVQDEDPLPARFDRNHTRRILDALVDNAVKFSPPGSHIEIAVSRIADSDSAWARIDVRDDGPGIPPADLTRLFDTFRQGDGGLTRDAGGMGMGLALARKLAEEMGGSLGATSEPARGSTFSLLLPVE